MKIAADELPRYAAALGCSPCDFFELVTDSEPERVTARPTAGYTPNTGDLIYRETLRELLGLEVEEATVLAELAELLKRRRGSGEGR